jgi:type I restriction enzyme S subunit
MLLQVVKMSSQSSHKQTSVGKIPEDWEVVKLENIIKELIMGQAPPSTSYNKKGIGVPFVKATEFGEVYPRIEVWTTNPIKKVDENFLLISIAGTIGLVNKGIRCAIGRSVAGIKPDSEKINFDYLYYFLQLNSKKLIGRGSSQKIIIVRDLEEIKVIKPKSLQEQKAIAQILSTLDSAIQKVDEIIAKTERLKKGLMQKLLTKGIGHKEFKDTEIGKIPKEWEVVKLGDKKITEDIFYGITAKAVEKDTGLRMLRTTDIKNYSVDWNNLPFCEITEKRNAIGKYLLKKGDLIVARAGTVGISVLVEKDFDNIIFGSYLIKVKLKSNVDPKFIHYFFQSSLYWRHLQKAQGSTMKNINLPLLSSLQIPLPPIPEQRAIAQILSTINKKLELERKRKEKLEKIKKGLMNDLLTGKKRVNVEKVLALGGEK